MLLTVTRIISDSQEEKRSRSPSCLLFSSNVVSNWQRHCTRSHNLSWANEPTNHCVTRVVRSLLVLQSVWWFNYIKNIEHQRSREVPTSQTMKLRRGIAISITTWGANLIKLPCQKVRHSVSCLTLWNRCSGVLIFLLPQAPLGHSWHIALANVKFYSASGRSYVNKGYGRLKC